jgi:putative ABC transport system permease protein
MARNVDALIRSARWPSSAKHACQRRARGRYGYRKRWWICTACRSASASSCRWRGLHAFEVAGVWRDYARSTGTIQMRLSDYRAMTGDQDASGVALSLKGAKAEETLAALKRLPFAALLEASEPSDIRAMSMKIFDRSFAITYLLEAIAIVIGLFGVAATFSAQTLARAKEFGMLRHVGVTRRQVLSILAIEGGSLTALGIATGFVLGWVISLILVFVVNPQSFHWTMQLHLPWPLLGSVAGLLAAAAHRAAGRPPVAVRRTDTRRQGGLVMRVSC